MDEKQLAEELHKNDTMLVGRGKNLEDVFSIILSSTEGFYPQIFKLFYGLGMFLFPCYKKEFLSSILS